MALDTSQLIFSFKPYNFHNASTDFYRRNNLSSDGDLALDLKERETKIR